MKRFIFIFLIYAFSFPVVHSQFYSTGEAPARIKWKQLQTGHFTLVFPENMTQNAFKMADLMQHYYSPTVDKYNPRFRKIPVLLQPQSVLSNGYVTLAPWRMELITTAPQETYSQDWLSQLALHETRHVVQLASLNNGFSHGLGFFMGQISRGISAAQVPAWFFEGDAVDNETRLSLAGRGRQASFEMPLRTILDTRRKMYSYDKSLFGSYRDYVPDHYHFGYEIVKYGRNRFDTIWSDAINFTARHPYIIWPFAIRMKAKYGVFNSGMYRGAMKWLDQTYYDQKSSDQYKLYKPVNNRKSSVYTSYSYAQSFNDIKLITYRKSLNETGSFVILDSNGYEEKLLTTGYRQGERFDYKKDFIVWDEVHVDPRWSQRSYSIIRTLNLKTGKVKTLTRKSRYFAPSFSPGHDKIAVSENDVKGDNYLTIVNSITGNVINRISVNNQEIISPSWGKEDEIIFLTVSAHGKSLLAVNPETSAIEVLIHETSADLADPAPLGNYVVFSADVSGRNDIYAVNKTTGEFYRITRSQYGAMYPTVSGGAIYFSNYGIKGFDICRIKAEPNSWEKVSGFETKTVIIHDSIPHRSYSVTNFSKAGHLINVHSWLPFYVNLDEIRNNSADINMFPGFMLFNQNLLSTFTSTISYHYYKGYSYFRPEIEFRGWYPVIRASAIFGGPQQTFGVNTGELPRNAPLSNRYTLEAYLPLYFNTGSYNCYIQPSVELEHSSTYYSFKNDLKRGLNLLHFSVSSGILKRMPARQIYPALGQTFSFVYSQGVGDYRLYGNMLGAEGTTYLPGLFRNHSVILRYGIEKQNPETYFIPLVRIAYPRGYPEYVSRLFTSLKANYSFPLVYPDLALGPLIYIKRIRANLFYDISYGKDIRSISKGYTGNFNSYGTDLLLDFHALRILFPVSAGIRMGYKPKEDMLFSEFLFSVNMNRF
ncbi:MAG TPA: hypothetical protein VK179_11145 [Bacteroidales bacterium]|nr:hypothetical protein [Bacteroidales bacterium]